MEFGLCTWDEDLTQSSEFENLEAFSYKTQRFFESGLLNASLGFEVEKGFEFTSGNESTALESQKTQLVILVLSCRRLDK